MSMGLRLEALRAAGAPVRYEDGNLLSGDLRRRSSAKI